MKIFRLLISFSITIVLAYFFSISLSVGSSTLPPIGHFLNPFEGFWANAEAGLPPLAGEVSLEGLESSVSIQYDSNLIPHIIAKNDDDLYMAQGYVMASLRLWQMEFQTHAAAGRISELIGEKAVNFDRLQRRKGMVTGAEATLKYFQNDAKLNDILEAYTSGVNQYIEDLTYGSYPLEYKLMDYAPEPFTPLKTALILEYMIDNLTGFDNGLENTNIVKLFGKETFDLLFPDYPEGIDPTIPTNPDSLWQFEEMVSPTEVGGYTLSSTQETFEKPDPDNGSNNWAVDGSKTKSGLPILSNDTHLGLNLPSLWMLMQLQTPDQNVLGYTFPGALGITIGYNNNIAWGFTNAPRDTRDWYSITFKDDTKKEYYYDSAWVSSSMKIEEIKFKGGGSFIDTVYYTHHGPVVYDDSFLSPKGDNYYALKWTGHQPSRVLNALFELNHAKNYDEYVSAIQYWDAPPQNVIFASTEGDIALTVQGNFPTKWKEQGKLLLDGDNPSHEWADFIPKSQSAAMLNPERGFVSSANQHSVDSLYPYYYYNASNEYYRNRRINRLLSKMNSITPEDMMRIQMDSYSLKAEELLPIMLDSLDESQLSQQQQKYVNQLKGWQYEYKADELTPLLFNSWWRHLYQAIWDEFDSDSLALIYPNPYNTYLMMRDRPDLEFYDYQSTEKVETLSDLINMTFITSMEEVDGLLAENPDYKWGDNKATKVLHLARIPALSAINVQIDGHKDAINSTKPQHGPSQRLVVEMTSPPTAYGIYPGGQSGNPGSPYYTNLIEEWRIGKMRPLLLMQPDQDYADQVIFTQTLNPNK